MKNITIITIIIISIFLTTAANATNRGFMANSNPELGVICINSESEGTDSESEGTDSESEGTDSESEGTDSESEGTDSTRFCARVG